MPEVRILSPRPRNGPELPGLARAARRPVVGRIGVLQHGCSKRERPCAVPSVSDPLAPVRRGEGEGEGAARHRSDHFNRGRVRTKRGGGSYFLPRRFRRPRFEREAIDRAAEVGGREVTLELGRDAPSGVPHDPLNRREVGAGNHQQ